MHKKILSLSLVALLSLTLESARAQTAFDKMMDGSFQSRGIAEKSRLVQTPLQKACSEKKPLPAAVAKRFEAEEMKTIVYPSDGQYIGDWQNGEKIAYSGKGLTWTDKAPNDNGGGCYNCHELSPKEVSFGTIGPSLKNYLGVRGASDESVKYTWGKIYNAKAFMACSKMPRNGDAHILTESQIRDLMAYLLDPQSPVNKP